MRQSHEDRATKLDGSYDVCCCCACCSPRAPSFGWNGDRYLGPAVPVAGISRWAEKIVSTCDESRRSGLYDLEDPISGSIALPTTIMNCAANCPKGLNLLPRQIRRDQGDDGRSAGCIKRHSAFSPNPGHPIEGGTFFVQRCRICLGASFRRLVSERADQVRLHPRCRTETRNRLSGCSSAGLDGGAVFDKGFSTPPMSVRGEPA